MSQRPNVEDPLEGSLDDGVAKDLDRGRRARHVEQNLCGARAHAHAGRGAPG